MKIPKTVSVAGHTIKIVYKNELESNGESCVGLAFLSQDRIELARKSEGVNLSDDQLGEAFLHELIHIVSTLYSIGLNEKKTGSLGLGLYQTLKDNKLKFY